ncbi:MAG: hypothetical protein D6813_07605 [Calditrichaeota bacterium]|nr:MAG: hypothetical protein D6813_07605 [Calditrichota bacterium]
MTIRTYFVFFFVQLLICAPAWSQTTKITPNDPYIGTFSGSGLTFTLTRQNGQYSGSAVFEGQTLPIYAQKIGPEIAGVYVMQGQSLPFQARLQGDTLTLMAGGEVYTLTRQKIDQSLPGKVEPGQSARVKNDEWGMSFTIPTGWIARLTESGYVLGSKTVKGILLLLPNEVTSLDELHSGAQEGVVESDGIQLRLVGEIKPFGQNGLAANYQGTVQGKKARAYAIGLLSPYGMGAIIMIMVEPKSYTPEHTKSVEALARSIRFYKPPISPMAKEWKQKLSGCRLSYFSRYSSGGSGYTSETTIDLCAQGFFRYGLEDETVWNAVPGTLTGGYVMKYGKGSGTWQVVVQNGAPVLQLNYYNGKVAAYKLSTDEKGRTYLDGDRYLRTCDPNDQVVEARPHCW